MTGLSKDLSKSIKTKIMLDKIILEVLTVGQMEVNCYILGCKETGAGIVIDPGDDYLRIAGVLERRGIKAELIINTHGHIDHIGANDRFGAPIWIHKLDADCLTDSRKNLSEAIGFPYTSPQASRFLNGGERINLGWITLEIIHTPGHTPGGICIKSDGVIFTGDTLFCGGIGRTDLPGGSKTDLIKSIKEKIFKFDGSLIVYPGHGRPTTIDKEKRENPFLI